MSAIDDHAFWQQKILDKIDDKHEKVEKRLLEMLVDITELKVKVRLMSATWGAAGGLLTLGLKTALELRK